MNANVREAAVPPRQPLEMPTQDLRRAPQAPAQPSRIRTRLARWFIALCTGGLTTYATWQMWLVMSGATVTTLQALWVGLFGLTFGWIAFSACASLAGLLFSPPTRTHNPPATHRTALLMPVYNESAASTSGALCAMAWELHARGLAAGFEIFLLSDTKNPEIWIQETAAFDHLRRKLRGVMPVWYRRRHDNQGRKAGNIQEFVGNWGGRYEYMIVLDADSYMTADSLLSMVAEIQSNARLGLVQSVPALIGGHGLLPRMQQFAGFLYGPVVARGTAAWQGDDGNYWGHNAIIRTAAFASACGLPRLRGPAPIGGEILSHDFVEAALLRRAGWGVRMLPQLAGSYEQGPPALAELAARDRRWAQGNLQHAGVIGARGLHAANRTHFLIGIMSYLASPLWLSLLALGLLITLQANLIRPEYFSGGFQLFPTWPRFDAERMQALFWFSLTVLFFPRVLGLIETLVDTTRRRAAGGGLRLLASTLLETLLSTLYAPMLMLIQSRQVLEILRGKDSGWQTQRRHGGQTTWTDSLFGYWVYTTLGLLATGLVLALEPQLGIWLAPTLTGLILAVPLAHWSGSQRLGNGLRRVGWLLTPEETARQAPNSEAIQLGEWFEAALANLDLATLVADPHRAEIHFHAVQPGPQPRPDRPHLASLSAAAKITGAESSGQALQWLERDERLAVLSDRRLFAALVGCDGPKLIQRAVPQTKLAS